MKSAQEGDTARGCLGFVVLVLILAVFLNFWVGGSDEESAAEDCENTESAKTKAYIFSQFFVEEYLKSPSTADFPSYYDTRVSVRFLKECHFGVTAFVDSQNSFGGISRTNYELTVIVPSNDNESYRTENLRFY